MSACCSHTSRCGPGSNFRQQKLSAWTPMLTAGSLIPLMLGIGVTFVVIGALLFVHNRSIKEHVYSYSDNECKSCEQLLRNNSLSGISCKCSFRVEFLEKMEGPVFIYYGLTNYYQNLRRYVTSRSDKQLLGFPDQTGDCAYPYEKDQNGSIYVPCGAVANSLFNDTFVIIKDNKSINLTDDGIVWETDLINKFINPKECHTTKDMSSCAQLQGHSKPNNWAKPIAEMDYGLQNRDLIVWMRTAALPDFRKPWRIVKNGMEAGTYNINITYNYPVHVFDGGKKLIISEVSLLGGRNNFLGVAYLTVGCICIILAIIFTIMHIKIGVSFTHLQQTARNPKESFKIVSDGRRQSDSDS